MNHHSRYEDIDRQVVASISPSARGTSRLDLAEEFFAGNMEQTRICLERLKQRFGLVRGGDFGWIRVPPERYDEVAAWCQDIFDD